MEKIWLKEISSPFSFNKGMQLSLSVSSRDLLGNRESQNRLNPRELEKSWKWFNRFSPSNSDIFKTIERETQALVF
jgi:hypothetical protein